MKDVLLDRSDFDAEGNYLGRVPLTGAENIRVEGNLGDVYVQGDINVPKLAVGPRTRLHITGRLTTRTAWWSGRGVVIDNRERG